MSKKSLAGMMLGVVVCHFNLLFIGCPPLQAQAPIPYTQSLPAQPEENPLFASDDVFEFKLAFNYKELMNDRGEKRGYHKATLTYPDKSGAPIQVNLKVMARGNRRRNPAVCRFPPLMLNFSRKSTPHTVFEKVNKLKLVTHCIGEDLIIREYLVYKLYNIVDERSFRVRLCQIAYTDMKGRRNPETRYGFLIEDDKEMAKRNQGKLIPKARVVRMDRTDAYTMAKLALFQYMIGNTDWSVPFRHNIKLISPDTIVAPFPVPYDFDYAGIVGAPYALPPPELGIKSARQRLYRGYSFSDKTYREVINFFNIHRADIYKVYTGCDLLDKKYRKQTVAYLDDFYKTINNPKAFRNSIVKVGQRNQEKYVVVTGLEKE
ncbi:hypothetical protein [Pontibacter liquoris]|uniref:hypothetical protein n=1 Tax=Pontibacter liquoris TaxID=2905677 RepID=UPI001FA6FCE5|nr:hypothetical protein [Pontibacter liquoris]